MLNRPPKKQQLPQRVKTLGRKFFELTSLSLISGKQRFKALKKVPSDKSRQIHILLMRRKEYLGPSIRCLNSIWYQEPNASVTIWVDSILKNEVLKVKQSFHRPDRLDIKDVPLPGREWQRNKLEIIVKLMEMSDLFTDADMIWNSVPPRLEKPLFFVDEYDLGKRTNTRWLLKQLGLDRDFGWRMLNVSVVALGEKSKYPVFANRSIELYEKIRTLSQDSELGSDDLPGLHRMAEQIALSIAAQELGEYRVLKETDSYMDGGLAESYYLGAINGYD